MVNCAGETKCRFCRIRNGKDKFSEIDVPIVSNEDYIAIASVGGFIPGWTLIIPKEHTYSMRKNYSDLNFIKIADEMIQRIEKQYKKNCIIFEHGANHENSVTACGTNHAHMHILPYEGSLLDVMENKYNDWISCQVEDIEKIVGDKEYWFYAENVSNVENTRGYVHIIEQPESQFFRKILAEKEGIMEKYSYKEYTFEKMSEETSRLLRGNNE